MDWSRRTFGEGRKTLGLIKHIEKELEEIRAEPRDLEEWCDVMILGIDGAWRAGFTAEQIAWALEHKQAKNMAREWPQNVPEDEPIEHKREVTQKDLELLGLRIVASINGDNTSGPDGDAPALTRIVSYIADVFQRDVALALREVASELSDHNGVTCAVRDLGHRISREDLPTLAEAVREAGNVQARAINNIAEAIGHLALTLGPQGMEAP